MQKVHKTEPSPNADALLPTEGKLNEFMQELRQSYGSHSATDGSATCSALEMVEQEREVAYEVEEEREV